MSNMSIYNLFDLPHTSTLCMAHISAVISQQEGSELKPLGNEEVTIKSKVVLKEHQIVAFTLC